MMFRAICSKEFYKIRWMWCILLLLNMGVSLYVLISVRRLFLLDHPEIVWYRVLHLGQTCFDDFRFLPLLSGVLLACFQFLPEIRQERLKLSLHLPISPRRLIFYHVGVGLLSLGLVLVPMAGFLWGITWVYFPGEMITTAMVTAAPWILGGAAAYLGGTLVLLEPNVRLKACNALIGAAVTGIYFFRAAPGAYANVLPVLMVPLLLMFMAVLYPAFRFRYRRTH